MANPPHMWFYLENKNCHEGGYVVEDPPSCSNDEATQLRRDACMQRLQKDVYGSFHLMNCLSVSLEQNICGYFGQVILRRIISWAHLGILSNDARPDPRFQLPRSILYAVVVPLLQTQRAVMQVSSQLVGNPFPCSVWSISASQIRNSRLGRTMAFVYRLTWRGGR